MEQEHVKKKIVVIKKSERDHIKKQEKQHTKKNELHPGRHRDSERLGG